jgi:hypothetical protein
MIPFMFHNALENCSFHLEATVYLKHNKLYKSITIQESYKISIQL